MSMVDGEIGATMKVGNEIFVVDAKQQLEVIDGRRRPLPTNSTGLVLPTALEVHVGRTLMTAPGGFPSL